MGKIIISCFLFAGLFATANVDAQVRKIDTSGYQGNIGYRVWCNNKNAGENDVSVSPKGFDKEVRDLSFPVRGRLRKILVEDVNEDGYKDLVMAGNLLHFQPQLERLDARYGHVLLNDGKGNFNWIEPLKSGLQVEGMVKDIQLLKTKDKNYLLFLRNNDYPALYRVNNTLPGKAQH